MPSFAVIDDESKRLEVKKVARPISPMYVNRFDEKVDRDDYEYIRKVVHKVIYKYNRS